MAKSIKPFDLLSEEEYLKLYDYEAEEFLKVGMGAEAVLNAVEKFDLSKLSISLREEIINSTGQKNIKATKK